VPSSTLRDPLLEELLVGKGKNLDKGPADTYTLHDRCSVRTTRSALRPASTGASRSSTRVIFGLSCASGAGDPACPARAEI